MFLRQTLRSAIMLCGVVVLVAAMGREFFRPALNRLFVTAKMPAMVVAGEPEPAPYLRGSRDDQLFRDGYERAYFWVAGHRSKCPPTFAVAPQSLTLGWMQGLAAGKRELGAEARRWSSRQPD